MPVVLAAVETAMLSPGTRLEKGGSAA